MVGEVNKIIGDVLAIEGAVHLPGTGSLYVEPHAAERVSSRRIRRSYKSVEFTSQQRGRSIADVLAEYCDGDGVRAAEIYEHWRSKCFDGRTLKIEGVGSLDRKSFAMDEAFDRMLNPAGRGEAVLRRRSGGGIWLYVLIAPVIAALAVGAGVLLFRSGVFDRTPGLVAGASRLLDAAEPVRGGAAESTAPAAEAGTEEAREAAAAEVREPSEGVSEDGEDVRPAKPQQSLPADEVNRLSSGRSYVVLGVFSTPENALRAVASARAEGAEQCAAFAYGPKYMVALTSDDSRQRCEEFMRSSSYENLWIYTAR
ncbi:MAG: hypothetical protein J1D86_03310 [Alistipes sp.]|nr:hypothetical protein [Alistipes sp.]